MISVWNTRSLRSGYGLSKLRRPLVCAMLIMDQSCRNSLSPVPRRRQFPRTVRSSKENPFPYPLYHLEECHPDRKPCSSHEWST